MVKPNKKIVLRSDGPCPCGSGRPIASCHLAADGRLRKSRPLLKPPGPVTGFSHPSCYLNGTCNCSEQISREHYISRSVLQQLGTALRITGAPWLPAGESKEISIENLTAKILCDRHNEALSPLDAEAGHFFSSLITALRDLDRKTLSRRPVFHLVGGEALELWLLKVACGVFYAIGSIDRARLAKAFTIDMAKVQRAFFEGQWDVNAGLHMASAIGSSVQISGDINLAPLLDLQRSSFCGVIVTLLGFRMELIFDTTTANPGPWANLLHRPTELVLKKPSRLHSIIMTWPPGAREAALVMARGNQNGR
jgi:hypothetical protein